MKRKTIKGKFLTDAADKSTSAAHRQRIDFNMGKYHQKVAVGKQQFKDLSLARQRAKEIKADALQNLPELLEIFEHNFKSRGGQVHWAENRQQALQAIQSIATQHQAQTVVKSKSMITEEIGLNDFLQQQGIEVLETDLGEFIVQIRGEKPYHIVTPAMHLSKEDIAQLFHQEFDTSLDATPEEMTAYVRALLRQKFAAADIGISGGNFIIAETGSIALVTNEGNARLTTTLPKVHIAIVGIEKMIRSLNDLNILLPVLATFGTGQELTVYNTILSGGRLSHESDGPKEMHVILLDNGRSDMLADDKLAEALQCIRCGSCLNNCPVYQTIGGHTYQSPYSGPIGAVISPHLDLGVDYSHLSEASSLCGSCTENCPVGIDLHGLLLYNRHLKSVSKISFKEKAAWKSWQLASLNRSLMNAPAFTKNTFSQLFLKGAWGTERVFPIFPKQTFNQIWEQKRKKELDS